MCSDLDRLQKARGEGDGPFVNHVARQYLQLGAQALALSARLEAEDARDFVTRPADPRARLQLRLVRPQGDAEFVAALGAQRERSDHAVAPRRVFRGAQRDFQSAL